MAKYDDIVNRDFSKEIKAPSTVELTKNVDNFGVTLKLKEDVLLNLTKTPEGKMYVDQDKSSFWGINPMYSFGETAPENNVDKINVIKHYDSREDLRTLNLLRAQANKIINEAKAEYKKKSLHAKLLSEKSITFAEVKASHLLSKAKGIEITYVDRQNEEVRKQEALLLIDDWKTKAVENNSTRLEYLTQREERSHEKLKGHEMNNRAIAEERLHEREIFAQIHLEWEKEKAATLAQGMHFNVPPPVRRKFLGTRNNYQDELKYSTINERKEDRVINLLNNKEDINGVDFIESTKRGNALNKFTKFTKDPKTHALENRIETTTERNLHVYIVDEDVYESQLRKNNYIDAKKERFEIMVDARMYAPFKEYLHVEWNDENGNDEIKYQNQKKLAKVRSDSDDVQRYYLDKEAREQALRSRNENAVEREPSYYSVEDWSDNDYINGQSQDGALKRWFKSRKDRTREQELDFEKTDFNETIDNSNDIYLNDENEINELKLYLAKNQNYIDLYDGQLFDRNRLVNDEHYVSIDYIIPLELSGDDSISNKILTKSELHYSKGDLTPFEWMDDENFDLFYEEVTKLLKNRGRENKKRLRNLTFINNVKQESYINDNDEDFQGYEQYDDEEYYRESSRDQYKIQKANVLLRKLPIHPIIHDEPSKLLQSGIRTTDAIRAFQRLNADEIYYDKEKQIILNKLKYVCDENRRQENSFRHNQEKSKQLDDYVKVKADELKANFVSSKTRLSTKNFNKDQKIDERYRNISETLFEKFSIERQMIDEKEENLHNREEALEIRNEAITKERVLSHLEKVNTREIKTLHRLKTKLEQYNRKYDFDIPVDDFPFVNTLSQAGGEKYLNLKKINDKLVLQWISEETKYRENDEDEEIDIKADSAVSLMGKASKIIDTFKVGTVDNKVEIINDSLPSDVTKIVILEKYRHKDEIEQIEYLRTLARSMVSEVADVALLQEARIVEEAHIVLEEELEEAKKYLDKCEVIEKMIDRRKSFYDKSLKEAWNDKRDKEREWNRIVKSEKIENARRTNALRKQAQADLRAQLHDSLGEDGLNHKLPINMQNEFKHSPEAIKINQRRIRMLEQDLNMPILRESEQDKKRKRIQGFETPTTTSQKVGKYFGMMKEKFIEASADAEPNIDELIGTKEKLRLTSQEETNVNQNIKDVEYSEMTNSFEGHPIPTTTLINNEYKNQVINNSQYESDENQSEIENDVFVPTPIMVGASEDNPIDVQFSAPREAFTSDINLTSQIEPDVVVDPLTIPASGDYNSGAETPIEQLLTNWEKEADEISKSLDDLSNDWDNGVKQKKVVQAKHDQTQKMNDVDFKSKTMDELEEEELIDKSILNH